MLETEPGKWRESQEPREVTPTPCLCSELENVSKEAAYVTSHYFFCLTCWGLPAFSPPCIARSRRVLSAQAFLTPVILHFSMQEPHQSERGLSGPPRLSAFGFRELGEGLRIARELAGGAGAACLGRSSGGLNSWSVVSHVYHSRFLRPQYFAPYPKCPDFREFAVF